METTEIKSLEITGDGFQIKCGKALTIIELLNNGKPCGRDLVFRNPKELESLISALFYTKEWLKTTHGI